MPTGHQEEGSPGSRALGQLPLAFSEYLGPECILALRGPWAWPCRLHGASAVLVFCWDLGNLPGNPLGLPLMGQVAPKLTQEVSLFLSLLEEGKVIVEADSWPCREGGAGVLL